MSAVYMCSKCFSKQNFEDLSAGQQYCKACSHTSVQGTVREGQECRGAFPVVKCTYCRSEFQQESKGNITPICKKCEANVKLYGKPSACEYCNIIAAFIGSKCQRCTNAEKKFGPPVQCEQCKQKSAFDRKEEDKKVDGKLLCWLCTLSYKRALAKTKQTDPARHSQVRLSSHHKGKEHHKHSSHRSHNKRPQRPDVTKMNLEEPPPKAARNSGGNAVTREDPNSSDHMVAVTQLREQIASLQRQLSHKDVLMLGKEKQITELKAVQFTFEQETRVKMRKTQAEHDQKVVELHNRLKDMQKEMRILSKGGGRRAILKDRDFGGSQSGSGTDSPSLVHELS